MLHKLRIASVLLIIGTVSGLLIWATHTLTAERIEENRIRRQYETFVSIFPDMDVTVIDDHREAVEHSMIKEIITVYNSAGDKIGYLYIGRGTNVRGDVDLVIGVDTDYIVVEIMTSSHSQSPGYLEGMRDRGYFDYFTGQALPEIGYKVDAYGGATQTHELIKAIIESAKILVVGDPLIDALRGAIADMRRYEVFASHFELTFDEEITLLDGNDEVVGFAFMADVEHEEEDYRVALVTDTDDVFKGFVAFEEEVPETLTALFEPFEQFINTPMADVVLDADFNETLEAFLDEVKDLVASTHRIHGVDHVTRYSEEYVGDDLIGYRYRGNKMGWNDNIYVDVVIGLDDVIVSVEIAHHVDTPYNVDNWVIANLHLYEGLNDPVDYDTDVYRAEDPADYESGATRSGNAVYDVVVAAHAYHIERNGE